MSQAVVVRFRPLKLITCICGMIALILVIISLSGTWLKTAEGEITDSLWQSCDAQDRCVDGSSDQSAERDWLNAVRAFAILSLLLCFVATAFRIAGWLCWDQMGPTFKLVAGVFMGSAMLSIVIALIIFPVKTLQTLPYRDNPSWFFHWAYGVAWGGVIFMIGFIVLLFLPEQIDQQEETKADKIYYVNNGSRFETNA